MLPSRLQVGQLYQIMSLETGSYDQTWLIINYLKNKKLTKGDFLLVNYIKDNPNHCHYSPIEVSCGTQFPITLGMEVHVRSFLKLVETKKLKLLSTPVG